MKTKDEVRKFSVPSMRDGRKRYVLYFDNDGRVRFCTCPHYTFRLRAKKQKCKHMIEYPTMEQAAMTLMRRVS